MSAELAEVRSSTRYNIDPDRDKNWDPLFSVIISLGALGEGWGKYFFAYACEKDSNSCCREQVKM